MSITIRAAVLGDAEAMAALLNPIIVAGGTTAYEDTVDAHGMRARVFDRPGLVSAFVALDAGGSLAGYQWVETYDEPGVGSIATFARREEPVPGTGRALFQATRDAARSAGLTAIDAIIRADNTGGLAFYDKMGFEDYDVTPGVPLKDGTPVDRIRKRLRLKA